jgi:hypothetical protein
MSRNRRQDNQNDVQLFPFVAVLLCTMGSLLVLLIFITRSSKTRAIEEAAIAQAQAKAVVAARVARSEADQAAAKRQIAQLAERQAKTDAVREQAAQQLRKDQLQLSHLEDHMRRLRDQLEKLQLAAAELNSLQGEHVEDRKQAQSEVDRLQQLIAESQQTIERLRGDAKQSKFYAIVPYQGRRGTFRRPIYIECRERDVVLQPEGVVFTEDDFRPPVGPGNALVAALRAAREHIVQFESTGQAGNAAEPYPLIIVRPKGIAAYYCVREAIQSWDDEFGYELVEEDWQLKYAPANPLLATKEIQAAELARARLQALAAAAPQAYGAYRSGGGFGGPGGGGDDEEYEYESATGSGSNLAGTGGGTARFGSPLAGSSVAVVTGSDVGAAGKVASTANHGAGSHAPFPAGGGKGEMEGDGRGKGAEKTEEKSPDSGDDRYASRQLSGVSPPGSTSSTDPSEQSSGSSATQGGQPERNPDGTLASGSYKGGDDPEQQLDNMARAAAAEEDGDTAKRPPAKSRGKDWAIANGKPGMIPIRRTIQIVVRDDALAILPEASSTNQVSAAGQEFKFGETPGAAYEDLVAAVEKRIKDWGMAGEGLYWRPVVELRVAANGDHRVNDLMRLLKFSGADIRGSDLAQHEEGNTGNESR